MHFILGFPKAAPHEGRYRGFSWVQLCTGIGTDRRLLPLIKKRGKSYLARAGWLDLPSGSPPPFVGDGPDHRPDGQQRADHRFQIGGLDKPFGDKGGASDGQDLADQGEDCGFQHGVLQFKFHWWW